MRHIVRHSLVLGLAILAALALPAMTWAASQGEQQSTHGLLAHPSFRAGQSNQAYYRETTAQAPAEVAVGPVNLDWQNLYQAQLRVNNGQDTWRLDPVQVARLEGASLGFDPAQDKYTLVSKVDVGRNSGTGEAQVLVEHSGRAYIVQLIQPFGPGPGMIWTVNSVREITSADEANAVARQASISFQYLGPYGPALATWRGEPAAQPQAPVTTTPVRPGQVYYVQPGDTLWAISVKNGVALYRLIELNPTVDANALWVGQVIIIQTSNDPWAVPGQSANYGSRAASQGTVHIVEPGDTLWQIALRYNAPVQAIMEANGITDANVLWVGQRLVIP
ncbi:MAG: LysM peptidoglycan-binding domain-containing protein [Betaproteobacteria bacterium]